MAPLADPDEESRRKRLLKAQRIMERRFKQRGRVKKELLHARQAEKARIQIKKFAKEKNWKSRLEKSPLMVNLLAENERIEEENKIRLQDEARKKEKVRRRQGKLRNEIFLKALQEASDLDALRAEKRLIVEEERRLKALMEVEKTKLNRKQDLMAAMRAERQRKQMQREYRRQKRVQFEQKVELEKVAALKEKLGLK